MRVYQSRSFEKKVKKLNDNQKYALDNEIRQLLQNPLIGTEKKGDLRGVFVHKFKLQNQPYLLAYRFIREESLELIMLGQHENYYRDLKGYLKSQ
ncbi:MAG: addiction module toxin RelE [Desulfobulbaceae bacterium A2]|nr:MAG: addiction module toxin RelE [Desulfobulbaceae bacterium A2]